MAIALGRLVPRLIARFRRRPRNEALVPLVDDQGRPAGLMDRMTAEYLQSTAADPSQSSLDDVLAQANRVRVVDWEEVGDRTLMRTRVLAEIADAASLIQLRDCLRIIEDRATFGHCMCIGEEALELHGPAGEIATIGLHHGRRIRWDAWKHDPLLIDGRRLLSFLADRGLSEPLERYEEALHEAEEVERAAGRWRDAMPPCLAPFPEAMAVLGVDVSLMRQALELGLPDPTERALTLFHWLGSGAGPWSGYPSYEAVAERLLLAEPTGHLVRALTEVSGALTDAQLEGAARYFSGWEFRQHRRDEVQLLPRQLRESLLAHALRSTDADKVERARAALAE